MVPQFDSQKVIIACEELIWWHVREHHGEVIHFNGFICELLGEFVLLPLKSDDEEDVEEDDGDVQENDKEGKLVLGHHKGCPGVSAEANSNVDLV